jgi:hypothetical protein
MGDLMHLSRRDAIAGVGAAGLAVAGGAPLRAVAQPARTRSLKLMRAASIGWTAALSSSAVHERTQPGTSARGTAVIGVG